MQMVKIQIPDRDECARGFAAMIRRGRVDCFRDNVFIVPDPALELLDSLAVGYIELGRGDWTMLRRRYEIHLPLRYNSEATLPLPVTMRRRALVFTAAFSPRLSAKRAKQAGVMRYRQSPSARPLPLANCR